MAVEIRPIDESNWYEVCKLDVYGYQADYVASNAFSLAQAAYEADTHPMAICLDGKAVGFLMWNYDEYLKVWCLCRLMVDARFQKRGIAAAALTLLMDRIRSEKGRIPFYAMCDREAAEALRLFGRLGFVVETGRTEDVLLRIHL